MRRKRYRVLTGLVHSYCKPYESDSLIKAVIALIWRIILYQRGWIVDQKLKP